jgi:putative membrane protein
MLGTEGFAISFWWILPIVIILLCFFMMRGSTGCMRCGHRGSSSDSALEILNKRYASGEIDKQEYDEKKKTIRQIIE